MIKNLNSIDTDANEYTDVTNVGPAETETHTETYTEGDEIKYYMYLMH